MLYLLLGYLSYHFTLMYLALQKSNLLDWWLSRVGITFAAVLLVMTVVFLVAKKIKRYDLVDAGWGLAFMTAALASYVLQYGAVYEFDIQTVTVILVWLWGIRLTSHIIRRIRSTNSEDGRYVELRKGWRGDMTVNVFLRMYFLQAALATVIALPVLHINFFADFTDSTAWTTLAFIGVGLWCVGFVIETLADRQLRQFVTNTRNKGKIMTLGLWRFSRHPNYFGELLQWWGIAVICLGTPAGWFGIAGPIVLTYLILFVSGIPPTEKRFEGRKDWPEYKRRTSVIIPFFRRQ
jgi:steroid 5-alpha reductase family enzyme